MPKATIEVEGVPKGYEPVRFGTYAKGDKLVTVKGVVVTAEHDCMDEMCYLIVREEWTPGNITLKPGWIAMDANDVWCWYEQKPRFYGETWQQSSGAVYELESVALNWTTPPCDGPEDSLREIKGGES